MIFNKGDMVTTKKSYIGSGHVYIIVDKNLVKQELKLKLFLENERIAEIIPDSSITWHPGELVLIRTVESIDKEENENPGPFDATRDEIMKETALRFIYEKTKPSWLNRNFDNLLKNIEETNSVSLKEGKDMNKVLKLYFDRERFKIMNDYNIAIQKAKNEDEIQKLCIDFEKRIREIVGDNEASLHHFECPLYTDETKLSIESIEQEKDIKLDALHKKAEEIDALLDLSPNYEESLKILRDYDIIDKKKNIML